MGVFDHDRDLGALTALCRELAKLGVSIGFSDARPGVVIRSRAMPSLWITVDASGEFLEWDGAESRPSIADPVGAAVLISEHVKAQRLSSGEAL